MIPKNIHLEFYKLINNYDFNNANNLIKSLSEFEINSVNDKNQTLLHICCSYMPGIDYNEIDALEKIGFNIISRMSWETISTLDNKGKSLLLLSLKTKMYNLACDIAYDTNKKALLEDGENILDYLILNDDVPLNLLKYIINQLPIEIITKEPTNNIERTYLIRTCRIGRFDIGLLLAEKMSNNEIDLTDDSNDEMTALTIICDFIYNFESTDDSINLVKYLLKRTSLPYQTYNYALKHELYEILEIFEQQLIN